MGENEVRTSDFDAWQRRLFDFALEHRRPCTLREWRLLRHVFAIERMGAEELPQSMAADGESLNTVLANLAASTWTASFRTDDDSYHLMVTFRPQADGGDPAVYLKLVDGQKNPVPQGKIVFPGGGGEIVADDRGRARLSCAAYLDLIRRAMAISMVGTDGVTHPMEMD